jgi:hypothetical protein
MVEGGGKGGLIEGKERMVWRGYVPGFLCVGWAGYGYRRILNISAAILVGRWDFLFKS